MTRFRPRGDRGTTLAELLVSMLILGLIMLAVTTITIGFQRANGQTIARQDQVDVARTASERMSKTVRTAVKPSQLVACAGSACTIDAFISASQFGMKFYANLDNQANAVGPSQVTYSVALTGPDAGVLIEKVQTPDPGTVVTANGYQYCDAEASSATVDCKKRLKVRRLATGVLTNGTALFSYYGGDGNEIPLATGASLTATQLDDVLGIELTVRVQSSGPTKTRPTTYIQRVLLPNSQAILRPGEAPTP